MFKKMKERMAAAADAFEVELAASMEPGETVITHLMASSAGTKHKGGSEFARVVKAVQNIANTRHVEGGPGSVARRFPDDRPMTKLVVSDRRLRLLDMHYGIKAQTIVGEVLRVERSEITGTSVVADDLTRLAFADGSSIVLRWGGGAMALPDALARMGIPTLAG